MNSFKNTKTVIIGGSQGVGLATAKMIFSRGGKVVIASRSLEKLKKAKSEIGEEVQIYQLDGSREKQVCIFFSQIENIDHLVITAPGIVGKNIPDLNVNADGDILCSNLWAQMYAVKYGVPKMVEHGSITLLSGIINKESIKGRLPHNRVTGEIETLGKMRAIELFPLRVNMISPGSNQSPALNNFISNDQRVDFFKDLEITIPADKKEKIEQIAKTALFLMDNEFITGSMINVDGG